MRRLILWLVLGSYVLLRTTLLCAAGDWNDAAKAIVQFGNKIEQQKLWLAEVMVNKLYDEKDYKATLAVIDEIVKIDPKMAKMFAGKKFAALCFDGQVDNGLKVGQQVLDNNWDEPDVLNAYFWEVIDPDLKKVNPEVARLAVKASERAVELTKDWEAAYLDTLAVAQFRANDLDKAIATEEKAIAVEKARKEPSESDIKLFGERIDWFRKQAAQKADSN
jgi:tetratricopeptide (TPR) repeat protein